MTEEDFGQAAVDAALAVVALKEAEMALRKAKVADAKGQSTAATRKARHAARDEVMRLREIDRKDRPIGVQAYAEDT